MNRRHRRDPAKEQHWRHLLRDWDASGQSRARFCRDRGISAATFDYWRREIAQRDAELAPAVTPPAAKSPATTPPSFIPVRVVTAEPLEIRLADGRSVAVPAGFDPKHLRAVLDALEGTAC